MKNRLNYKKRNFIKIFSLILFFLPFIPNLFNHNKNYRKKKLLIKEFSKIWILGENDS